MTNDQIFNRAALDKLRSPEKLDTMIAHITQMVAYKGEYVAMRQARKLVIGYFKGMRGAAALRNEAGKLSTLDDLYQLKEKVIRG